MFLLCQPCECPFRRNLIYVSGYSTRPHEFADLSGLRNFRAQVNPSDSTLYILLSNFSQNLRRLSARPPRSAFCPTPCPVAELHKNAPATLIQTNMQKASMA